MSTPLRSVVAAVERASARAIDATPSILIGTVTAWASPLATVSTGTGEIPNVKATDQVAGDVVIGSSVVVVVHGSSSIIIGTV